MQFISMEQYSLVSLNNSSPDASGPQCRSLVEEAFSGFQEGVAMNYTLKVTIGKKAS